jgi:phosphatidylserine decarboxylase
MTLRRAISGLTRNDRLNFLLTNAIPRRLVSTCVGRISNSRNRLVRAVSLGVWGCFAELDLADAEHTRFASMPDCFTRRLKPGARPQDPDPAVLTSPCDAILGAFGAVSAGRALQVKGMDYTLTDLLGDADHAATFEGGVFVTLRLTSAMYHRFHAPHDCRVTRVRHIHGDCWNVNPPTLRRVRRLFCRNERVVMDTTRTQDGQRVTLVAVAAILVSGVRLGFLTLATDGGRPLRRSYACDAALAKGAEMGWFEHGSTIIMLAPAGLVVTPSLREGDQLRVGQKLLHVQDAGGRS